MNCRAPGLIIAAPSSGSGKTVVTLGLLRALARRGVGVASAKVGPDYIDPAFHAAASGRPCLNLDGWALRPASLAARAAALSASADLVICEGVMGLFDGADGGDDGGEGEKRTGSTADIAAATGWPVVLLVDARGQSASAAALVAGFARHRADVPLAGLLFNRVGSPSHRAMIERAVTAACPDLPILGWLPRAAALSLPERHLGLVQAGERAGLETVLDAAAAVVADHCDLEALRRLARPSFLEEGGEGPPLPPLGGHVAVARDCAFAFTYQPVLEGWRRAGAALSFFSPLAGQGPDPAADAVYLPGGYPELHAPVLAAGGGFLDGLRAAAARGAWIFGECGGFMVLGEALEDAEGRRHAMAGLLPLVTSFARRRLHLGYRRAVSLLDTPLGPAGSRWRGHEFHYSTVVSSGGGVSGPARPLFDLADAAGRPLGAAGLAAGRVMGSYLHLVDREM